MQSTEHADPLDALFENAGLHLIDDTLRQAAYEAVSPEQRGWLKMTLALNEAVRGQQARSWRGAERPELGFRYSLHTTPADWTLCIVGPNVSSASRMAGAQLAAAQLAAALMTARLAGQEHLVVSLAQPENTPDLVTVLELTGIESAYCPAQSIDWQAVTAALITGYGPQGRVLLFDASPLVGLTCWESTRSEASAVSLGAGLEGCWLYADLTPDFFTVRRIDAQRMDASSIDSSLLGVCHAGA